MKNSSRFHISFVVTTSSHLRESDFLMVKDDVIDGFNFTRDNRLGDITEKIHLKDAGELTVCKLQGKTDDLPIHNVLIVNNGIVQLYSHRKEEDAFIEFISQANGCGFRMPYGMEALKEYADDFRKWQEETKQTDFQVFYKISLLS